MLGVVPDALLSEFQIWQNEADALVGYQRDSYRAKAAIPSSLLISLTKVGKDDETGFGRSEGTAVITRVFEKPSAGVLML